ncbi:sensor histidine kinase [Pedobacter alpinus]|uniref:histidine kinase n=1 Tax=Pedobacter alpinus TaxID=1590643 RepID=A0ABW5TP71_9SPHI
MQEEKLRISRELHDNIGAQLSFINGSIQSMANADSKNEQLQHTQQVTQNTIKELRSTVWLINQQEFGLEEFVVKLREYLKPYYGSKPNIGIVNQSDKDYSIEPIIATNLFRIIQELVNNAIKHAEANTLEVKLVAEQNKLIVSVKDDGKGYDLNAKLAGYGLKNIQVRVKTMNATCNIDTAISSGTEIYLTIPI